MRSKLQLSPGKAKSHPSARGLLQRNICTTRVRYHNHVRAALVTVTGEERKPALLYLLSDHVGVVGGLCLEGAVVGPEVNRWRDASDTAFVYLPNIISDPDYPAKILGHIPCPPPQCR